MLQSASKWEILMSTKTNAANGANNHLYIRTVSSVLLEL